MNPAKDYYSGKTAVVTGAASGIGLAMIEELLQRGAEKAVLADFNRENLEKNEARLSGQYPGQVKGILCDVTCESEVCSLIAEAAAFFGGRLDLLINNAGAAFSGAFAENTGKKTSLRIQTNEDWEKAFALNFYGPLYGCRAALPLMLAQGSGQIVNVISGIAFVPMPYQTMYSATKAALNGLTLALRAEYADSGVSFSSATPGTVATAIFSASSMVPAYAQQPRDAARRILAGVEKKQRIIYGDDTDEEGAKICFSPDVQDTIDEMMAETKTLRQSGGALVDAAAYLKRL